MVQDIVHEQLFLGDDALAQKNKINYVLKEMFIFRLRIYFTHGEQTKEYEQSKRSKKRSQNRQQENYDGLASRREEGKPEMGW